VLIKASAGGGGKCMRVCRNAEEVSAAIEGARREAQGAFGDDTLILEKYLENPRHVEIQILGDQHGQVVHLFERECSIQRRHQKIIEETPSVALTPALREQMGKAAVAIGKAIGYASAGTVEFILAQDGAFYFLEVNTRLQVEHPITECITGLDLVREQIRVAMGEPLGYAQADLSMTGAAVECRLYAEDPKQQFLPQSGKLVDFRVPEGLSFLRVDSGIERGSDISIHYDPMIAKVVTHGRNRSEATQRMIYALERLSVHGIETNREFLIQILRHPEYEAGRIHTHFIEQHMASALAAEVDKRFVSTAAIAATLAAQAERRTHAILPGVRAGYRNNRYRDQRVEYSHAGSTLTVHYRALSDAAFHVEAGELKGEARVISFADDELVLELAGHRQCMRVVRDGERHFVQAGGRALSLREEPRFPESEAAVPKGGSVAPMPGRVVKVDVVDGQRVTAGQRLLVMEAMKMEHAVNAPEGGVVHQVLVRAGQQVDALQLLVVVQADASE
jgi:acetyl/propionyl-CoA carboxylase alpha subunit